MFYYIAFWVFIFGLCFGSFLNCMAMRIVRKEDFISGRSHCMDCGHELAARDLLPLVSYAAGGGRCRYCGTKISARYPLAEVAFALLIEGLYLRYGLSVEFAGGAGLTGCLFVLSLVDMESFEIPDGCLIAGAGVFFLTAPFVFSDIREVLWHIAAGFAAGTVMLILSIVMDAVLKKESLGGGDIKLFALLGMWFGFAGSLFLIFISCIVGLLFAAAYQLKTKSGGAFPFGPSIAASAYVMLLYGNEIRQWYLQVSGLA